VVAGGNPAILRYGKQRPHQTWSMRFCTGIERHIDNPLLADRSTRRCSSSLGRPLLPRHPQRDGRWSLPLGSCSCSLNPTP